MKRPGWLGGEGAGDEPDDAGEGEPRDGDEAAGAKEETAAERSARRVATRREQAGSPQVRRRLADRVGKASGDADEKTEREPKQKPEPKAEEDAGEDEEPKPAPKRKPDGKAGSKPEPEPKPKAGTAGKRRGGDGKELHRPRRQREDEPAAKRSGGKPKDERAKHGKEKDREREDPKAKGGGPRDRARRRRDGDSPSPGRRVRTAAAGFSKSLRRGAVEARKWAAANGPKAGRALLAALGAVFAIFFDVIGFVLNVLIAGWRLIAGPVRSVLGVLDRTARAASRVLTPARALAIVVAGAAILLALSQYADYRSISIGNDAYSGVQTLAPAPETGRLQTGDAHSYVFVPIAIACLLLLGAAMFGGRWRLCRLITLAGLAAVIVAIVVDRPAGLDPGDAAVSFEGVKATLIGGFYAQMAAGVLLIGSSSLLARELRLAGSTERATDRRRKRRSRRKLDQRAPDAGGARA